MASSTELGVEDVEEVLRNIYALEGEVRRDEFHMFCPVHSDRNPSCDVNLATGYWNCWSCPARGDLVALGCILLENLTLDSPASKWRSARRRIRKLLRPGDPDSINAAIQSRLRSRRRDFLATEKTKAREPREIPAWGSYEDGPLNSLLKKGLTKETLERWGVRYVPTEEIERPDDKPFTIKHSLGIPILSETGDPFAWCYRSTSLSDSWQPRFIYTPDPSPPLYETWFGMYHHRNVSEIAIVEGTSDAMMCDQWDIPALAIMGANVTTEKSFRKVEWLSRYRMVTIMTDHDRPGAQAAITLATLLHHRGIPTRVARYHKWFTNPQGEPAKDPGEMCRVDLELLYERAVPFSTWVLSQRRGTDGEDD